jgi:hypothetical protein
LKVLFEFDENDSSKDPPLRRTELVALLNTMDRLSHSLSAIKEFRAMIDERDGTTSEAAVSTPAADKEVLKTKALLEEPDDDPAYEPRKKTIVQNNKPPRRKHTANMTVSEEFMAELDLVYRTFVYVLHSWTQIPGKL